MKAELDGVLQLITGKAISIIGTRSPTPKQRDAAQDLAYDLSAAGVRIRTGAAYGIDEAAMMGALWLDVFLPWKSYNR